MVRRHEFRGHRSQMNNECCNRVQLRVAGIPHRESQALVTTLRQAGGFAAISRWLSASDTTGFWNNNDAHPGGVPPVISIERFSINAHGRRCDPSGVRSFSPHGHRGWSDLAPPPANGLQAFGLNEASSPTVREESFLSTFYLRLVCSVPDVTRLEPRSIPA